MKKRVLPSIDRLREVLAYDPITGVLVWAARTSRKVRIGSQAGSTTNKGYRAIRIDGMLIQAHRIAWALHYGRWPEDQIDHRDGDRQNNRIANLRECLGGQNQQNMKRRSDNASGVQGVALHAQTGKWRAYITVDGKRRHLGLFSTVEEASKAHSAAKRQLHSFNPEVPAR